MWSHDGLICTGETYKNVVKMTFPKGAALEDHHVSSTPASMATPGVPSTCTRAIDEEALKALVRAAVKLSASRAQG